MKAKEYYDKLIKYENNLGQLKGLYPDASDDYEPDFDDAIIAVARDMFYEMKELLLYRRVKTLPGINGTVREFEQKWKAFAKRDARIPANFFPSFLSEACGFEFSNNGEVIKVRTCSG